MKKQALLILLLIPLLFLSSCTASKQDAQSTKGTEDTTVTTDTETTKDPNQNTEPKSILGIWYSLTDNCAIEVRSHESVTYYALKTGYYEYESQETAQASYTDSTLKITLASGKEISWSFDEQAGTLTGVTSGSAYTLQSELPTEYLSYSFPDFSALNCETLVTLGNYADLTLPDENATLAARDIFDSYYQNVTDLPTVSDRKSQAGDYVNVNYKGMLDGVAFSGGTATDQKILIVENSGYIPGFAEGIAGHSVGETFEVPVTFPENYGSAELAGKAVIFEMTLNAIYDMTISDEDIKTFTENEYDSYQALLDEYTQDYDLESVLDAVMDGATFSALPADAYNFFFQYYRDIYHQYAYYYGMDYDYMLNLMGYTEELFLAQAQSIAKSYIAVYAIAKANDIGISDETLSAKMETYITELIEENGITREEAEVYAAEQENSIRAELLYDAVGEYLLEIAEQNTAANGS